MTSKVPHSSQCSLSLYYIDDREPSPTKRNLRMVAFSETTAKKANDVVCDYFKIQGEWDKKLLKCVFLDDIKLSRFELKKAGDSNLTLGIQINGNREVVYNKSPEELYKPIEDQTKKILVSTACIFGKYKYDLTFEQITQERRYDYSVIALYNSTSFTQFVESGDSVYFSRMLEKLNI